MGENKTMDSETLYRLERQAYFFYPYEISTLTKKLEDDTKFIITEGFQQCRNKYHAIAAEEGNIDEFEEFDNPIQLVKDNCLQNCQKFLTKVKDKLEEMTFISNDLDLFNYSQQHAKKIDETENEFQRLKQELLEQKVFIAHLTQELNDYEQLDPLLTETEQIIETLKNLSLDVPDEIKQQLVDMTSKNSMLAYTTAKHL